MDAISSLALAGGLSWASGIRLYATVAIVGILNKFGYVTLPESLAVLSNPMVIGLASILMMVEFIADKLPYVDTVWDSFQTFIRIPAGALLALGAMNTADPVIATMAVLLGGSLAGATHLTKTGSRALINASPEPMTNMATSFGEEGLLLGGGWLALAHPMVFLGVLAAFILLMIWLLPKLWQAIKSVLKHINKLTARS